MAKKVFEIKKPAALALYNKIKEAIETKTFEVETTTKGFDTKLKSFVDCRVEDSKDVYSPHSKLGKVFNSKFIKKLNKELDIIGSVENLGFIFDKATFSGDMMEYTEILNKKFMYRENLSPNTGEHVFNVLKEYIEVGNTLGTCVDVDDLIAELNYAANKRLFTITLAQTIELLQILKEREKVKMPTE